MKRCILSIVLTFTMIVSAMPFTAFGVTNSSNDLDVPHENLGDIALDQYVYFCSECNNSYLEYMPDDTLDYISGQIVSNPVCGVDVMRCECRGCGNAYYLALSAEGHTPVDFQGQQPDCNSSGYTDGKICKDCNAIVVYSKLIPATGKHTLVTLAAKAPTCTATGLTAGKQCSVCKEVTVKQNVVNKKAHVSNAGVVTKKATYDATGIKTYSCTVCKQVLKNEVIAKLAKTSLKKAKFTVKDKTYTGKALTQSFTVKLGSKTLKNKVDYTISYKNNKNIGKATVTIKGIGAYKDSVSKTFAINPKKVSSLKLKAGKKQLTVSWKKDSKVGGYEIVYATSKNFKSGKKTVKITKASTAKKVISKLKSKKTYYVKVRAFKKVGGKTYYGAYTSVKSVKVK